MHVGGGSGTISVNACLRFCDEAESNRKASSPFAQRKDSPVYHCTTRCVRQAFLLEAGKSNRKEWLENRIEELA